MGAQRIPPDAVHTPSTALHTTARDVFRARCGEAHRHPRGTRDGEVRSAPGAAPRGRRATSLHTRPRSPKEESTAPAVTTELDHVWSRIDADLRRAVTDSTYSIWVALMLPVDVFVD